MTCSQTSSQIAIAVELLAEPRQQFEVLARIDHGRRIERVVEQHRLGLVVEDAAQHLLVQPPVRRLEPQQARNAAGLADDRQIGVVDRLEHDDFVARLDHGEDRRGQRLGAARGHHHLGHRIEVQAVPAAVMRRDRLAQFRNPHHRGVLVVAVHRRRRRPLCRISSGPGSSGKPWPRLMALLSRAACDIASKMVTGRSAKTLFMDVMAGSAAGLGRQSRGLPPMMPPARCLSKGKPAACAASEAVTERLPERQANTTCLPCGSGMRGGIEGRKRRDHAGGIGFHHDLVRLAHVDQEVAPLLDPLRHLLRLSNPAPDDPPRQILQRFLYGQPIRRPPVGAKVASGAAKIKHCKWLKRRRNSRSSPAFRPRPPARSGSGNSRWRRWPLRLSAMNR